MTRSPERTPGSDYEREEKTSETANNMAKLVCNEMEVVNSVRKAYKGKGENVSTRGREHPPQLADTAWSCPHKAGSPTFQLTPPLCSLSASREEHNVSRNTNRVLGSICKPTHGVLCDSCVKNLRSRLYRVVITTKP